jgi:hypothetical protein
MVGWYLNIWCGSREALPDLVTLNDLASPASIWSLLPTSQNRHSAVGVYFFLHPLTLNIWMVLRQHPGRLRGDTQSCKQFIIITMKLLSWVPYRVRFCVCCDCEHQNLRSTMIL